MNLHWKERRDVLVALVIGVVGGALAMLTASTALAAPAVVPVADGGFALNCTVAAAQVSCTGTLPTVTPTTTVGATPTPTPTSTPTVSPTTAPPTTTPPMTPSPSPTVPPSGWPDASNTGVPPFTVLTAYTGPCNITVANTVIDAKTVACSTLRVQAPGVKITRTRFTGTGDPQVEVGGAGDLTMSDSTLAVGVGSTGIADKHWSGTRLNIFGGNRGAYCATACTLMDSWVHGTRIDAASGQHASGIRAEQFTLYQHNTLSCDLAASTDACSADVTMYADFAPIHDVRIINNLMIQSPSATFCAYGGTSGGKPYSNDPTNATNIVFTGNVFQRGPSGHCAGDPRGAAVTAFDRSRSGNVWSNNKFDDGVTVNP